MSTAETALVIRTAIDAISAAQAAGVDFSRLGELFRRSRAEGRDITDEEIQQLAGANSDALAELDSAIAARKGEPQA